MNQIYAESDNRFPLENVNDGTVFIYDYDYYIRTQQSDKDGNIICVRLRDGYVAHFDPKGKYEIFTGTLRMECK